jgi:23S rRNA pseudouridine2605 synthase
LTERLNRFLARAGVASRRAADALIASGAVRVNGEVPPPSGVFVDPDKDVVTVDGQPVRPVTRHRYVVINKPLGVITTARDEEARTTVLDVVGDEGQAGHRLFPVGRLDADTSGLLLLTDDGELAFRLTHPRYKVAKEYIATVIGNPTAADLETLRTGVKLEEGVTAPAEVETLAVTPGSRDSSLAELRIVIREGRHRQVRRMVHGIGHKVHSLRRVGFGPLKIGRLKIGGWRLLGDAEVTALRRAVGIATGLKGGGPPLAAAGLAEPDPGAPPPPEVLIAIDGGVASGKSAVGKRVAEALGLPFVDSGLMYRAVTKLAAERGIDPNNVDAVTELARKTGLKIHGERVWADGVELTEGIFDADHMDALPQVSAIAGVREALVAQQRRLGQGGVVMAGRDIGTVVFPDADYKFFLTASLEEKVSRRAAQYEKRGEVVDQEAMRKEVEARDRVDTERAVAPLRPAPDAIVIDTDHLTVDEVVDTILKRINERRQTR